MLRESFKVIVPRHFSIKIGKSHIDHKLSKHQFWSFFVILKRKMLFFALYNKIIQKSVQK